MNDSHRLRKHWQLDPSIAFLNHGSFGACPTIVLEAQREFQNALEKEPIRFLAPERGLEPILAVPTAIDFLSRLRPGGFEGYMASNHALAIEARQLLINILGIDALALVSMIGSLVTLPVPNDSTVVAGSYDPLQPRLFDYHEIEVPVFSAPESTKR